MRRLHFWWTFLVGATICTAYGGFTLIYHLNKGNGLKVHALILLVLGLVAFAVYFVLYVMSLLQKKKKQDEPQPEPVVMAEEKKEEVIQEEKPVETAKPTAKTRDYEYVREPRKPSRPSYTDAYVKKVGYGPVLRFFGNQILDMRNNTYYRFQDNYVYVDGGGVAFEINNKRIRNAFGSYAYEISGSNINKTFGGFFASISGNYISKYDNSEKYEMTDSLTSSQLLVAAILLFGE